MRYSLQLFALIALVSSPAIYACPGEDFCVDPSVPRRVTIRIWDYTDLAQAMPHIQQYYPGTVVIDEVESRQIYELLLPVGVNECDAQGTLENALENETGAVDFNRPLRWVEAGYGGVVAEGHTGSVYDSGRASYAAGYPSQYALAQMNIAGGQAFSRGYDITVAVIDTGIDAGHPGLAGFVRDDGINLVREGGRLESDTRDIGDGIDSNGNARIDEMVGHGTFVAGLIHLTAPQAQLLPIVAIGSDGESDCFVTGKALFLAIDAGVQVINCSFGSTYDSIMFQDALIEAANAGITVVGASGNRGLNPAMNCPEFPAMTQEEFRNQPDLPLGISVSAVLENDQRVASSSYYFGMWIAAAGGSRLLPGSPDEYDPAASIISTLPGGDYGVWEGTSFASAFTSGAAALLRGQHPWWPLGFTGANPARDMHDGIRQLLASTGTNIDAQNPGFADQIGRRLNVESLLRSDLPGDFDRDGIVSLQDMATLLANFGLPRPQANPQATDIDHSGIVELQDLAILLANFGM